MSFKPVSLVVPGLPTEDGNRVPLTRLVPGQGHRGADAFRAMDPFLLMDHFGPMVLPPGTDAGFPPHPHRGLPDPHLPHPGRLPAPGQHGRIRAAATRRRPADECGCGHRP